MRIAYADPPYPGQASRRYADDPNCAEVDHALLFDHLQSFDGWALSTSSTALVGLLPFAPPLVRIAAWVKPFAAFKRNVSPAYAWEPVLFKPSRGFRKTGIVHRDWHSESITLKRGLCGVKPDGFSRWLFEVLLGAERGDEFTDVFPGSGAVTRAWDAWNALVSRQEIPG